MRKPCPSVVVVINNPAPFNPIRVPLTPDPSGMSVVVGQMDIERIKVVYTERVH